MDGDVKFDGTGGSWKKKSDVEDALRVDLGSVGTDAERKLIESNTPEENCRHSAGEGIPTVFAEAPKVIVVF